MTNLIKLLKNDKTCPYKSVCDSWDDDCVKYCNESYDMCVTYDYYRKLNHQELENESNNV